MACSAVGPTVTGGRRTCRKRNDLEAMRVGSRPRSRHLGLLWRDGLQPHRASFPRLLDAAQNRRLDLFGRGDALAVAAEGTGHRGIVAGDVGRTIFFG